MGLVACGAADGGDAADDNAGGNEGALVGGQADTTDPAVVAIVSPNSSATWVCSGTVIAPTKVLTAAHCVEGGTADKHGWRFQVFFGADKNKPKANDPLIDVVSYAVHPEYINAFAAEAANGNSPERPAGTSIQDRDPRADGDIAVLTLAKPAPVKPMTWNAKPIPQSMVGKPIRFVGYGRTSANVKDSTGVKRTATLSISHLDPSMVSFPAGEIGPCHGDSGGPMLLNTTAGEVVIGVGHMTNDESCKSGGTYTRSDFYADFVGGAASLSNR